MKKLKLLILFVFSAFLVSSQEPQLEILTDSVKVGEPFDVSLTYLHKSPSEIFFPDSTTDYGKLEYINHIAYPTNTDSLSLDSAVYSFSAFSINDSVEVQLELIQLSKKDTIKILSNTEHVFIKRIVTEVPDSITLKTQLEYVVISAPVNYNLFILLGIILLIVTLILLFIFKKELKSLFKNYFLKKKFQRLFEALDQLIQSEKFDTATLNRYSGLSKKGLELIFKIPVSSYTSSQMKKLLGNKIDTSLFSELDTHIYRSTSHENVADTLLKIKLDLEKSLNRILEEKND